MHHAATAFHFNNNFIFGCGKSQNRTYSLAQTFIGRCFYVALKIQHKHTFFVLVIRSTRVILFIFLFGCFFLICFFSF